MNEKEATQKFIDYIDKHYYKSYLYESEKYERLNNSFYVLILGLGFTVTLITSLSKFFGILEFTASLLAIVLPMISSMLMLISNQKGWKRKEQIRENARIKCKHLINEARIRFVVAKTPDEYVSIYRWLNLEVEKLQMDQSNGYFVVHNKIES